MYQGRYWHEHTFGTVEQLRSIAEEAGMSMVQIAVAWIVANPVITAPIIGASKMAQLEQAVTALDVQLSDEDCAYLEEPYQPHPVLGHS